MVRAGERKKSLVLEDGKILHALYLNSRISISELSKKFNISHHTMDKYIKKLEQKYDVRYTLNLDTEILGLSEPRIIAVKFDIIPDIVLLKRRFEKDPFIQNAYYGTGDFDLLLHVICHTQDEYALWEYKFRLELCYFKPRVKIATLNSFIDGFMPVSDKIIKQNNNLQNEQKKIIIELIKNSRIRLKELAQKTKLSQAKINYAMTKLQDQGIIKSFTTLIQNPSKRILLFYGFTHIPNEYHHPILLLKFLDKIIDEEDYTQASNDYALVSNSSGHFDTIFFCNFNDATKLVDRGPEFLKKIWATEFPLVDQFMITGTIIGMLPFNTNGYIKWNIEREIEKNNPVKFKYAKN